MSHKPRTVYTERELREAELADLEIDYKCAVRDGLHDYAEQVLAQILQVKQRFEGYYGS